MTAYYNDTDLYCVEWLRALIREKLIAPGVVDERPIQDIRPYELAPFSQCHFFAGIGGWSRALRLAGVPDDFPLWTGSCPCQPFSQAGRRLGFADERHLWPFWQHLIQQCRPSVVLGEQVARAARSGWLDTVAHGLEEQGYAFGATVLPACAVSAPHIRERIWFVAYASSAELREQPGRGGGAGGQSTIFTGGNGEIRLLADPHRGDGHRGDSTLQVGRQRGESKVTHARHAGRFEWGAEPDVPRVVDGVPNRMERCSAFGNAIVPQVAAEFIRAAIPEACG